MFEKMSARKAYLDIVKEQHMMNAISLCLSSYDEDMSSEEVLHCLYQLEINKELPNDITMWEPFQNWSPNQIANYIFQIAETAMYITINALDNVPANYKDGDQDE